MHLYAYFEDETEPGRRNPAFDTDIFLHYTPEDLEKLRGWCEEAADERPHLTYVIVDLDHRRDPDDPLADDGVIDVFGRLLREQEAAIDWNEVREQARAHGPGPGTAEGCVTEGGKP